MPPRQYHIPYRQHIPGLKNRFNTDVKDTNSYRVQAGKAKGNRREPVQGGQLTLSFTLLLQPGNVFLILMWPKHICKMRKVWAQPLPHLLFWTHFLSISPSKTQALLNTVANIHSPNTQYLSSHKRYSFQIQIRHRASVYIYLVKPYYTFWKADSFTYAISRKKITLFQ